MNRLILALGKEVFKAHIDSLPEHVSILSACSGSGAFELAANAVFGQLERVSARPFYESRLHHQF